MTAMAVLVTQDLIRSASPVHDVFDWLAEAVADPTHEVSLGAFGAVGQFPRGPRTTVDAGIDNVVVVTETARMKLKRHDGLRPIAFETLSSDPCGWNIVIALCLPFAEADMSTRTRWSALGPDTDAIDPVARMMACFDVGLGNKHADILVRPGSSAARRFCAKSVGKEIGPDMLAGLLADEDWIFATGLGRIETSHAARRHILPQLLSKGTTHVKDAPIPDGYVPVGYVFPLNPRKASTEDAENRHDTWERMLDRFGEPELVRWKRSVQRALTMGVPPASVNYLVTHAGPPGRAEITGLRIALRQRRWLRRGPIRPEWETLFDPALGRNHHIEINPLGRKVTSCPPQENPPPAFPLPS